MDPLTGSSSATHTAPFGLAPGLEGPRAEVDLAALAHNVAAIRSVLTPPTRILAAVKANAYGHGLAGTSLALERLGVDWFGVAAPSEALVLRRAGVTGNVLLLTPVREPATVAALLAANVSLVVTDGPSLDAITAALPGSGGHAARLHLKVDTGMGRLGLGWRQAADLAQRIDRARGVRLEGVWTHCANSEDDRHGTAAQFAAFDAAVDAITSAGIDPGLRHVANSAAIFGYPEHHYELVRPGIVLYGYHPAPSVAAIAPPLTRVMRLSAPVTFVKRVQAGTSVSYEGLWTAPRETTVATVRIGYADGFRRGLTGRAEVALRGRRYPVVGRICMDQLMVDVGDDPVAVGDRVTLFGPGGPGADEVGRLVDTVSYEMLVGLAERVERVYVDANERT